MFDEVIHFAGLGLFGAAWLLVGGWALRAAIRGLAREPRPKAAPLASIRA
jgi:hypothetical protein